MATATIKHNDYQQTNRVRLALEQRDGLWVWIADEGDAAYETDVTGRTRDEAIDAARRAWSGAEWDLVLSQADDAG